MSRYNAFCLLVGILMLMVIILSYQLYVNNEEPRGISSVRLKLE